MPAVTDPGEPEVEAGRRAFATAQELLADVAVERLPNLVSVGWHDTSRHPERGSFAVVRSGAGYDDLFGDTLLLTEPESGRQVYAYVLGSRDVPADISLSRRTFMALGRLASETLDCIVELTA